MTIRIIIVTENASLAMGGEASRPLFCFRYMVEKGIDVRLVCHARVREELKELLESKVFQRIHFIEDSWLQAKIWKLGLRFPYRIRDLIFAQIVHLLTQWRARLLVCKLVQKHHITVVYEPSPNTPRTPSFMFGLHVPVVIGPLCGGLNFPPAFRSMDAIFTRLSIWLGRLCTTPLHQIARGKLDASAIIVANERTAQALPRGHSAQIYSIIESGVDLSVWKPRSTNRVSSKKIRFVYSGRFVDWKGVEYLLRAFEKLCEMNGDAHLDLIGSGELQEALQNQVQVAGLSERVHFYGWKTRAESAEIMRECDVFIMPSLRECGGTALLEAMAVGIPVIAVNWGGPSQIVDESCGRLIEPSSPEQLVDGLLLAMTDMAQSSDLRVRLGEAGIRRVRTHYFDWAAKIDRITEILTEFSQVTTTHQ